MMGGSPVIAGVSGVRAFGLMHKEAMPKRNVSASQQKQIIISHPHGG
ncbi:hypothetical protein SUS17_833 [Sphingomonas sp. S17]|nr:hypothetical protein SUS17_833 [Sphingomonas sp. S17]